MCGIGGAVGVERQTVVRAVRAINAAQAHRGPDDEGVDIVESADAVLALGHRRLSIIDLSPAGHQPMSNHATGDRIVFNGGIYNYCDLRRALANQGCAFASQTDTEVILQAFATWGDDCFARFDGMFAIAILDSRQRRLVLARDPLGIKPLYWGWGEAQSDSGTRSPVFLFASEVLPLVSTCLVGRDIDRAAVATCLAYGAVQEPLTIVRGVEAFEPGCFAELDLTRFTRRRPDLRKTRFWDFPALRTSVAVERRATTEEVAANLRASVASHLISDRPLGVFLSAGVDSTAIASLCAEVREGDVDLITVQGGDDPKSDESPIALKTARRLGARHRLVTLGEHEIRASVGKWLSAVDQPTIDGLNTFIISAATRDAGIVVALSGLGGDELFGGYTSFFRVPAVVRALTLSSGWTRSFGRLLSAIDGRRPFYYRWEKARDLLLRDEIDAATACLWARRLLSEREMRDVGLDPAHLGVDSNWLPPEVDVARGLNDGDDFAAVSVLESRFYMRNMLLRDADVASMRNGMEIRVPFLGRRVIDHVYRLTGRERRGARNQPKGLLLDALGERIPAEIRHRRKTGFVLPQDAWMRGPLRGLAETSIGTLADSGLLDGRGVRAIWKRFLRSRRQTPWAHAWVLVVLGQWMSRWTEIARRSTAH